MFLGAEQSQVDHVEPLDRQTAQVGLHPGAKLFGALSGNPAALGVALGSDLAHEHQVLGVWV